jgi:hypothetical protein
MKSFTVPMLLFFVVVGAMLLVNMDPQDVRNATWQAKNSSTVSTTMNWIPCLTLGGIGVILFLFFIPALSHDFGDFFTPSIGKEIALPKEVDKNGYIIAYRMYRLDGVDEKGKLNLKSTTREVLHRGGYLEADQLPEPNNTSGVYAVKSMHDRQLEEYDGPDRVLAEVRLWGKYVEGTRGYRAQHCQAIRIIDPYNKK